MREILGSAKCKCSICKKEFYNNRKEFYTYVIDNRYQCSYTCYLKAKAKKLKNKKGKRKTEYQSVTPASHRTTPNVELIKIHEVERRYGPDCWTRTDDTFINDPDVQFIRGNHKTKRKKAAS